MATITPVPASSNSTVTYVAATSGGDTIAVGSAQRCTLLVRNGGSSITVTLTAVNACNQGFLHNVIITCPAGDNEVALPASCIAAGSCAVTYSAVTSVTVAAITT